MSEHTPHQPIQPEARPMGPLLEGDQAIIDAAERIPMGKHMAVDHDGRRIAETFREQNEALDPLPAQHVVSVSKKKYDPKLRAEINPDGIAVADDGSGLTWLTEDNRLSRVSADSEPIIATKEAQDLKIDVAKKIAHIADRVEAADDVHDDTLKHQRERIANQHPIRY